MDWHAGMTEKEVLDIVRDILGDDATEEDIKKAYKSGLIREMCPDIKKYADARRVEAKSEVNDDSGRGSGEVGSSENKNFDLLVKNMKAAKTNHDADSEPESVASERHSSHHHKKKKKKHSKDHKRRDKDREERKEKSKSREDKDTKIKLEPSHKIIDLAQSSESENERQEKLKKEKKKRVVYLSSSSEESDSERIKNKHKNEQVSKVDSKDLPGKFESKDNGAPKVHPFYQDKRNDPRPSQPSDRKENSDPKREKTPEKKKEIFKPFSKYSGHASNINLRKWRPVLHKEHLRYQRKFRLTPVSVVCVNLLDLPMVFHHPRKHSKNPNAVPLASGINLSQTRLEMIRRLERDKLNWFRKKLNRRALKCLRSGKGRYDSSGGEDRKTKRARIMDRIISSSDSNSDSSSIVVPNKKARKDQDNYRERGTGKLSKSEREAEAKRRKLEEVKKKVDKFSARGTRVLPWENKDTYFKNAKKKDDPEKEKEKAIAEKKKRVEQLRKEKLEKQKNAPSVSFQRILKQIETANKEQAAKPRVELKIPKKNQISDRPVPISEYKLDGKIGVGDVCKEVTKLLSRNVLVECPVMAEAGDDLGEYTVKKISWWILKNEKDPAIEGLYHPECHDDEDSESLHEDEFDWPSDVSSITGCVSDPEGVAADVPPDPQKVGDPDWADDYCGEASLYAKFRKQNLEAKDRQFPIDSMEPFKGFLRVKPGTNYSKPNFEVKCFVCSEVLKGQRQFGAHIRSDSHKNNFRNYSLELANYEESLAYPPPKKVFVAHLVEYSTSATTGNSTSEKADLSTETKHRVGKIEQVRSDSPGPIVGGDAAPNIMVHQMPIPDDISLASFEDYDISSDESLMNVRVFIRTAGKWNDDLEKRWRSWRDEETKIAEEYNNEREYFINDPDRHPCYQEEWLKFWDQKCTELEAEGKDTENHDFQKEWLKYWMKRVQEIMHERVEKRVAELKRQKGIDKHTLRMRFGISAEQTKRKKKKRKVGKPEEENSSSVGKPTFDNDPRLQLMTASNVKQRNQNNVHSKPACLPTPSVNDEGRNRESGHISDNSQKEHCKESKQTESRTKHDNSKHKSLDVSRPNDRHYDSLKEEHVKIDRRRKDLLTESASSRSPDNSNSRSGSNVRHEPKSISSVSSAEPAPPGEDSFLLDGSDKKGCSQVIAEKRSSQALDINKRLELLSEQNSKPTKKLNTFDEKSNEPIKTKRVTSWSDDSEDEECAKKRQRRESGGSSNSSNTRTLQDRLKALREALADDEARTTKNSSDRPKVIPVEKRSSDKRNLSDGEVASDVSDLDMYSSKGVSTFVNKQIPGLANLDKADKAIPSSSNFSKNSLGYHLLDRKKSTEDHRSSNHTDRSKYEKRDERSSKGHHHQDGKPGKSKGHSSRYDDRDRHRNERRRSKDDRRKWDNSKDNRHNDHGSLIRNDSRGGKNHDYRNTSNTKHRNNNQPPFKNNQNANAPAPHHQSYPVEESWEPEDSWDSAPQAPTTPAFPAAPIPPLVPELSSQIPVLGSTSRQPHQPYNQNNQYQGQWNGGWAGTQPYPPHTTDPNKYYNDNYY